MTTAKRKAPKRPPSPCPSSPCVALRAALDRAKAAEGDLREQVRQLEGHLLGERQKRRWAEKESDGLAADKERLEVQAARLLEQVRELAAEVRRLEGKPAWHPVYPVGGEQGNLFECGGDQ